MEWGDKGCIYDTSKCTHDKDGGCEWCCMRCNTDTHFCGGCGTVTDHKGTTCPECVKTYSA
jgi:hypothetical protein